MAPHHFFRWSRETRFWTSAPHRGKSTELAAKLQGEGPLFSNDISNSRAKSAVKESGACRGRQYLCSRVRRLKNWPDIFEGFFDKILVDAPFRRRDVPARRRYGEKAYSQKGPDIQPYPVRNRFGSRQNAAAGGMMLYSTCTFDEEENEGTIRRLLKEHDDLHLVPLEKQDGFQPGIGLSECVRLFPHKIRGEGHFIALLKKDGRSCGSEEDGGRSRKAGAFGRPG